MKNFTFLSFCFFIVFQSAYSQCTMNVTGFGNNTSIPSYNIQGSVQVILNMDNTVTLNLMSNFVTASGPDVRVFLVDRGNLTNNQLKIPAMFNARPKIEIGLLSVFAGASSFTQNIPNGVTISDFETVYFYCEAFNAFWDFGNYIPFTSSNCVVLSSEDFQNSSLQLFPNPVTSNLEIVIDSNTNSYKIEIYNALGALVFEQKNQIYNSSNTINISELKAGIYFLKITDAENHSYQKRIIKN